MVQIPVIGVQIDGSEFQNTVLTLSIAAFRRKEGRKNDEDLFHLYDLVFVISRQFILQ